MKKFLIFVLLVVVCCGPEKDENGVTKEPLVVLKLYNQKAGVVTNYIPAKIIPARTNVTTNERDHRVVCMYRKDYIKYTNMTNKPEGISVKESITLDAIEMDFYGKHIRVYEFDPDRFNVEDLQPGSVLYEQDTN